MGLKNIFKFKQDRSPFLRSCEVVIWTTDVLWDVGVFKNLSKLNTFFYYAITDFLSKSLHFVVFKY